MYRRWKSKLDKTENEFKKDLEDYHNRPNWMQCSMCPKTYSFNEYLKLKSRWIDKNEQRYGKEVLCQCGAVFHKDVWAIQTKKENYLISTIHLQIGATSTVDWSDFTNYYYETMIFDQQNNSDCKSIGKSLDFQMRYKTREEAIQGHKETVEKLSLIIMNPEAYPMGIIPRFCNVMDAMADQKKTIRPSVKERLT